MWYIATRRREDGSVERYLDQRDKVPAPPPWKPSAEEVAATHEVCGRYAASNVWPGDFVKMVERGVITREVNALMAAQSQGEDRLASRWNDAPNPCLRGGV